MTVTLVRARDFHQDDFTDAELSEMKGDASTSAVMNQVRKDAGMQSAGVAIHGDDVSAAQLKEAWAHHDVMETAVDTGIELLVEPELGPVSIVSFAGEGLAALSTAEARGQALAQNGERAAMHWAMTTAIALPERFGATELARWSEAGDANGSPAARMNTWLTADDAPKAAVLQLHADRGMNAAQALLAKGVEPDVQAIVRSSPEVAKQMQEDPAFRAGVESLVWAKKNDAAAYDAALSRLADRDARYTQHGIRA